MDKKRKLELIKQHMVACFSGTGTTKKALIDSFIVSWKHGEECFPCDLGEELTYHEYTSFINEVMTEISTPLPSCIPPGEAVCVSPTPITYRGCIIEEAEGALSIVGPLGRHIGEGKTVLECMDKIDSLHTRPVAERLITYRGFTIEKREDGAYNIAVNKKANVARCKEIIDQWLK